MEIYKNLDGDSGVEAFEIRPGEVVVRFFGGATYLYTEASCGAHNVQEMQRLARIGDGLNAYIKRKVGKGYAAKLS